MTTKIASKPAAKRASRSSTKAAKAAKTAPAMVLNHTESIDAGDLALDELIASLSAPDEILETPVTTAAVEVTAPLVDAAMLSAAVSGAEATEIMVAEATPGGVAEGAAPTGDTTDVVDAAPVKKEKAAKEPKAPATPRKHYTDKTERLKDKLGAGLSEYSVLTLADAGVNEEELQKVMAATMEIIRTMNRKEQNWSVKFIEFLAGKKSSISEVTGTILKLLHTDGHITTGNDGNVFKTLVARPYSPGSARAMGGNNVGFMKDLKMVIADGKGKFVANPDSLLLMKANSMLFAPAATAA